MFKSFVHTAFALLLAVPAMAQPSTTASVTATLNVQTVLHIGITGGNVDFTGDFDAFQAGFATGSTTTSVSHRGNVRHSVTLAADASSFTASGGGSSPDAVRGAKPAADLEYRVAGSGTWVGASTTGADVVTQAARGAHNNGALVGYRIALAYADDTPGTYALGLTYTIAAD
jgi:hypothetical protein